MVTAFLHLHCRRRPSSCLFSFAHLSYDPSVFHDVATTISFTCWASKSTVFALLKKETFAIDIGS